MYISEWDLRCSHCDYQQLVPQGRNIHRDMAFHVYIRMGSTRCSAATTTSSVPQEKYTPRDMAFLHVYIRMGSTRCRLLLPAACATRKIYTGHGIPPCIYQNGIYGAATTTSSLCHVQKYQNITRAQDVDIIFKTATASNHNPERRQQQQQH
jgi:hypothetical protein